jgi:sugar O-acyltransferase (sialic acid O-acetyltransferase NeuD family)
LARQCAEAGDPWDVVALCDDARDGDVVHGVPVYSTARCVTRFPGAWYVVALGDPATRAAVAGDLDARGFQAATLVHPRVERSASVHIGAGSVVCAGSIVTVDVHIGRHVHVNIGCSISHDAVLEDFVTLSPGVRVCGWAKVATGAFLGAGATIIHGTRHHALMVGAYARVGAGAVVVRDIPANTTAVGVPARPLSGDARR